MSDKPIHLNLKGPAMRAAKAARVTKNPKTLTKKGSPMSASTSNNSNSFSTKGSPMSASTSNNSNPFSTKGSPMSASTSDRTVNQEQKGTQMNALALGSMSQCTTRLAKKRGKAIGG